MEDNENAMPDWLIPDKAYDVLKWGGLIVFPAIATCFGTIAPAWGMDSGLCGSVVLTINAIGTCVGVIIGASEIKARTSNGGDADGEGND